MANSMFDPGREGFLLGQIDWDTAAIKLALVRGYTYSAAHKFVSDVTGAGATLHATSGALTGVTGTSGIANANSVTFTTPTANANPHNLLLFQASAVTGGADVAASAQRLIAYLDVGNVLPITPNGADVTVVWDSGINKIFRL